MYKRQILDRVFFTDIKVKLKEKPEITDDMLIVDGDMLFLAFLSVLP